MHAIGFKGEANRLVAHRAVIVVRFDHDSRLDTRHRCRQPSYLLQRLKGKDACRDHAGLVGPAEPDILWANPNHHGAPIQIGRRVARLG